MTWVFVFQEKYQAKRERCQVKCSQREGKVMEDGDRL